MVEVDLYGEITFSKKRPKCYKYFDKNERVIYCSSFSKFLGPGLRLGWCIFPDNPDKYLKHKLSLNLCTNGLSQYVAASILRNEDILKIGQEMAKYYQGNIQIYTNVMKNALGSRLSLTNPTGSYFLWARVEGLNALEAYERAKKQKVHFIPGPLFSATRLYTNYLRINCAHEFNEKRQQELQNLCRIISSP